MRYRDVISLLRGFFTWSEELAKVYDGYCYDEMKEDLKDSESWNALKELGYLELDEGVFETVGTRKEFNKFARRPVAEGCVHRVICHKGEDVVTNRSILSTDLEKMKEHKSRIIHTKKGGELELGGR